MRLPSNGNALPERVVRRAHVAVNLTRRTVRYAQPTAQPRTHRLAALLLLVPLLVVVVALAAILLVAVLVVSVLLAGMLAVTALFIRRLPRPR
jgi:cobalamin synthase